MTTKEALDKVQEEFNDWADFRIADCETIPNVSEQRQRELKAQIETLLFAKLNLKWIIGKMEAK